MINEKKTNKDEILDPGVKCHSADVPFDSAFVPPLLEKQACIKGRPTSCVILWGCVVMLDMVLTGEVLGSGHSAH